MHCTDLELYKAMCSYTRTHNNPILYRKLKEFRDSHGLQLEPIGYTDFNAALDAINKREGK
jgi:lauroyl/myristoyl acyltransferase